MDTSSAAVTVNVALLEVIPDSLAVMMVVPSATDVASPFVPDVLLMVAIPVSEEFQVTDDVRSCVVLSEKVPMAMNCLICPRAMLGFDGVTEIDSNTGAVTVSVAEPDMLENVAVMSVDPSATAVAKPFELDVLLIVATPGFDEVQVAHVTKSCLVLSANVPVAANCSVVPLAMLAVGGVNAIDVSAEEVSVAEPVIPPYFAVIEADPGALASARPFEPAISLTVATPIFKESQVAHVVKFCTVKSASVPVAANCWVVPGAMLGGAGGAGVTVIDATGDVVSVVDPIMLPEAAVMRVEPMVMVAVANPCEPGVLLTSAIPGSDESQVTDAVRFRLLLSANVPVAVNCTVVPGAMLESAGATERDTNGAGVGGFCSLVRQLTIMSSAAHTAMIHGRGLFCMVSAPHSK
jgi:hypothetical protein